MTINRGLWVPINTGNVGTTEVEARLADDALFESNNGTDARSGVLAPAGTVLVTGKANMSYDLAACDPVINRVAGEGVYRFTATGTTNVATTAAPAANSRIDVIWVKQNDQSKGDADNKAVVGVTQGTAAASPVAPAIPAGALEIARATVGPNITATTSASITQTFRYTALKGAPIPVRNATERAEITAPRDGQTVMRLDRSGAFERYSVAPLASPSTPGWQGAGAAIPMASGYQFYGGTYGAPAYRVDQEGGVKLSGLVGTTNTSISMNAGTFYTLGTLPAEARPQVQKMGPVGVGPALGVAGSVYIQPNGDIRFLPSASFSGVTQSNFYISLDWVSW